MKVERKQTVVTLSLGDIESDDAFRGQQIDYLLVPADIWNRFLMSPIYSALIPCMIKRENIIKI
jgi:hypothetical protein